MIDLRSDTVTRPTPAMREAMAHADVGDDGYRDDPTARALEARAAELLEEEAALFVPSGTMANQIAIRVWTRSGDQIVIDADSHVVLFESTGLTLISQVVPRLVTRTDGWIGPRDVDAAVDGPADGTAPTRLVCVENTHNRRGGTVVPLEALRELAAHCGRRSLRLHMDGARLFNAAVASGVAPARFATQVDSGMFCLSKGLACPIGSVLWGRADFIEEARRIRQALGGGMRQVGVVAACGLVALDTMVDRLADDHRRARRLAEGLAECPGVFLDPGRVDTNIVVFELTRDSAPDVAARLATRGVGCLAIGPRHIRMVTHWEIGDTDIDTALTTATALLA